MVRRSFEVTRASTFDLHSAASFLLNMLYVRTTMTYYLGAQIEPLNGFKVDRDPSFGPLRSSKLISFYLLLVSASESSFVHEVREFLLHHLFDFGNGLLESSLGRARYV